MKRLLILMLFTAGCASTDMVQEELSLCPQYFQDNVGEAKILPLWSAVIPIIGGPTGWLNKDGSYTLTALAGRDVVLHEAFHSFDFKTHQRRRAEHKEFVEAWGGVPKPQLALYLACAAVPFICKIPVPGHATLYGRSNGAEDAAETFVFWMRGKTRNDEKLMNKCVVIENFVKGRYNNIKLARTVNPAISSDVHAD
jgi:hypothetical protein